jgi:GntR family transcriptional repressor for pyruvate dehydrogenase complex
VDYSAQPFAQVQPRRAVDAIMKQIRDRIQSNELRPGQKLPAERLLAEQMGVSRNTVREAIRMLEVSGLVTLKKGATGGAFLNDSNTAALSQNIRDGINLNQYDATDLIGVRLVLETYAVEQACLHATEEEIDELAAVAGQSKLAESSEPSYERRLVLHMDFHRKLAAFAHNRVLEVLTEPLLEMTRQFHLKSGPAAGMETHELRARLVQAIRDRDSEAATKVLAEHFKALQDRLFAVTLHS